MMKVWKVLLAVLMVAVFAGALAGCGEKAEEKKAEAPAEQAAVAEQAPATEQAPAAAEQAKTVKAGFVYVSPIGDAGYSYAQDQGRLYIDKLDWVETAFAENVAEGPDSERVIRNMARKGFDVIFATSFGFMDPMMKVASEFPDVKFMHCSGFKTAPNASNYFGRMYQARYLTGLVAGSMTTSNEIGYVAAMQIPEVIRGINAFTLGVRAVNPQAQVRVVWTNTWYDPVLEKDAAISLLDAGCDVITQHQDSPGPQEAAEERGAYCVGYNSDMAAFAPKAHLTAAIWNWGPLYQEVVEQIRDGKWHGGESLWYGMERGIVDIAPFGPMVPEDVKALVAEKKAELQKGNDIVFRGPIKNQAGEVVVADGATPTDGELLGMKYFVEGVVGSID
ncbi:BMP family ABC transporter substrate-binding protein [Paucidesulfovibrio longus]|uniref:BMP family ABC transporter substrate-binding protein n=1 Tax=Paucidesulfovibrio longus TaxID=889 RepID=UPI00041F4AC9|nr:BMP family ABC transporter substrate-binding protein [Paucidesulfovibrio longus]